jgi:hypothetical protein
MGHTNYEIRWKNYRAFRDTGQIVVRPLTILIGANNSGKSSIISPLLLLSQTMASRDSTIPLVTRGALVDAGPFKEVLHNHNLSKQLFLGLRYHEHEVTQKLAKIGVYPPGSTEITLTSGDRPEDVLLSQFEVFDVFRRPFFRQFRNSDGGYTLSGEAFAGMKRQEREVITKTKPVNFLFSPSAVLNALPRPRLRMKGRPTAPRERGPSRRLSPACFMYISAISFVFEELKDMLGNLSYVGPLRDRPKRYYEITGEMPVSVGSRGEHMANLLRRRLPDLHEELNEWIRRFGFGDRLESTDFSDEVFSLFFVSPRPFLKTNIADAGFGASQVLPLIVQALTAKTGSLTVAEQPEIHLNPRLQSVLADLFVQMANSDHRVIVETHSEHLLLRLRSLVASGRIEHTKVAIYFVWKERGGSMVRDIPLQKNGHISPQEWPKDFFEDGLRESLTLAAAQHLAAKSK